MQLDSVKLLCYISTGCTEEPTRYKGQSPNHSKPVPQTDIKQILSGHFVGE